MYSDIVCELRMETSAHDIPLPYGHDVIKATLLELRCSVQVASFHPRRPSRQDTQNFNLGLLGFGSVNRYPWLHRVEGSPWGQQLFDNRCPDEDAREGDRGVRRREQLRLRQEGQLHVGHEALDLSAEVVPVHPDVQAAYQLLATLLGRVGLLGQQDQACAGTPGGLLSGSGCDCQRTFLIRRALYSCEMR